MPNSLKRISSVAIFGYKNTMNFSIPSAEAASKGIFALVKGPCFFSFFFCFFVELVCGASAEAQGRSGASVAQQDQTKPSALSSLKKKADEGDMNFQYELGMAYYTGSDVAMDREASLQWFRRAAEQEHAGAQFFCYIVLNQKSDNESKQESVKWLEKAANHPRANPEFIFAYAIHLLKQNKESAQPPWDGKAIQFLEKAADAGDHTALESYGKMLMFGEGGFPKNTEKGVRELKRVAPFRSSVYAVIGDAYRFGLGVERDQEKAFRYYQLGAEKGSSACQVRLVDCFSEGVGTRQDRIGALEAYRDLRDELEAMALAWGENSEARKRVLPRIPEFTSGLTPTLTPAIFATKAAEIEKEIQNEISQATALLGSDPKLNGVVALYLDAAEDDPAQKPKMAKYRCYAGYGYSGDCPIPIGRAFGKVESMALNMTGKPDRKLVLDAGPPYVPIEIPFQLAPGSSTNLGRIVLQKAKPKNPVRIAGTVRDTKGKPIEGVKISAGVSSFESDKDGFYEMDGFGLEEVLLKTEKPGFQPESKTVVIRDDRKRTEHRDIVLAPPSKIKLRYVISPKGSDLFLGEGVEEGIWEGATSANGVELKNSVSTARMREFCEQTGLSIFFQEGQVGFKKKHAFVFFKLPREDISFDQITRAGSADSNSQRSPMLVQGSKVIILGFRPWASESSKVSEYCVKVEVLAITPTGSG